MEELKSLVSTITKNKVKQIDVIGNTGSSQSQVQLLYDAIASGKITEADEIAPTFFPDNENAQFYTSRLRKKLKKRLINTLFFIDVNQENFNQHNRAYFTCYKEVAAAKILIGLHARPAAIPIAEKALKSVLKYEFVELVLNLAKELRLHYGTITGDRKKFEEMDVIVEKYSVILAAEIEAEKYYADILSHYVTSKASNLGLKDTVSNYAAKLSELSKNISSPRFNFITYIILELKHEVINDYVNTLKICQEAMAYFETIQEKVPIYYLFTFALKMLICHIQLKNYDDAQIAVEKCASLSREGTMNWFVTWDYAMQLAFHSGKYQNAYDIYEKVVQEGSLSKQNASIRERWHMHEAYVFYLILIKKIIPEKGSHSKAFRLNKFLNEVPVYSRDRRGAYISILVLQILFLLQEEKFGDIIDRTEALNTYTYRYLRQDDTFRSNCFIKMLMTLPECSFHKKAVIRKAEKYSKRLQEVPLNVANQSAEIEIIPYETLWEFVLESLDEKWH